MRKKIWLAAGIAGLFFANTPADVQADMGIRLGDVRIGIGDDRPMFVIDTRPDFIYLRDRGFSVSVGAPYDIIYYGDRYYLYRHGAWYLSSDYRGPWVIVLNHHLPYAIRRHRFDDIWRYRDLEYRRHDRRYWDDLNRRYDRHYRIERDRRDDRFNDRRDDRFNDRRDDRFNDRRDDRRDDRFNDRRDGGRGTQGDGNRDGGRGTQGDGNRDGGRGTLGDGNRDGGRGTLGDGSRDGGRGPQGDGSRDGGRGPQGDGSRDGGRGR